MKKLFFVLLVIVALPPIGYAVDDAPDVSSERDEHQATVSGLHPNMVPDPDGPPMHQLDASQIDPGTMYRIPASLGTSIWITGNSHYLTIINPAAEQYDLAGTCLQPGTKLSRSAATIRVLSLIPAAGCEVRILPSDGDLSITLDSSETVDDKTGLDNPDLISYRSWSEIEAGRYQAAFYPGATYIDFHDSSGLLTTAVLRFSSGDSSEIAFDGNRLRYRAPSGFAIDALEVSQAIAPPPPSDLTWIPVRPEATCGAGPQISYTTYKACSSKSAICLSFILPNVSLRDASQPIQYRVTGVTPTAHDWIAVRFYEDDGVRDLLGEWKIYPPVYGSYPWSSQWYTQHIVLEPDGGTGDSCGQNAEIVVEVEVEEFGFNDSFQTTTIDIPIICDDASEENDSRSTASAVNPISYLNDRVLNDAADYYKVSLQYPAYVTAVLSYSSKDTSDGNLTLKLLRSDGSVISSDSCAIYERGVNSGNYYWQVSGGVNVYDIEFHACYPPPAPHWVTATPTSDTTIDLEWAAVSGAHGYRIYRNGLLVKTTSSAFWTDSGLAAVTQYCYEVRSYNSCGDGKISAEECATTDCGLPTEAPTLSTNVISSSRIDLTWTAVSGADGYTIFRDGSRLNSAGTKTSYSDTNLDPETTYCYVVKSVSTTCQAYGPDSNEQCVETDCVSRNFWRDGDQDGYGNPSSGGLGCSVPDGYVSNSDDCDDSDSSTYPGAPEKCDGVDNNCNGQIDENLPLHTYYRDNDGDGWGQSGWTKTSCSQPAGYASQSGDCNDDDASINPGVKEKCGDTVDSNCNGDPSDGCTVCTDADNDGYCAESGDCNDNNAAINPGASEACGDGIDNNCTNGIDEGCTTCTDADGDGYCAESGDCNDNNAAINPGASEVCGDGIDNDCAGGDQACPTGLPNLASYDYTYNSSGEIWVTVRFQGDDPARSIITSTDRTSIVYWYKNTGEVESPATPNSLTHDRLNGRWRWPGTALQPGDFSGGIIIGLPPFSPGPVRITASLDYLQQLHESNELDNIYHRTIEVVAARGDFDGNGQGDLLWQNSATGTNALWLMDYNSPHSRTGDRLLPNTPDSNWVIKGSADFNKDGHTDIVWRNSFTGANAVWFMDGTTRIGAALLNTVSDLNWDIKGVGDFNRDGNPDLVWRNRYSGDNAIWYMDGVNRLHARLLKAVGDRNWDIVGIGDFDVDYELDGSPDIVWRNRFTGANAVWLMDDYVKRGDMLLQPVTDRNWSVTGVVDMDGNSTGDIIWRNTATGQNAIWFMHGSSKLSVKLLDSVTDQNWQIVGPQ